jgi:hypothetical protein
VKPAIDIYAADRERIRAKDWAAIHVAGDRREPVPHLWPRLGRYLGSGIRRERGGFSE